MRPMTFSTQRFHPWLRAALVVYLLCTVIVTTVHQHHGALQNGDCALCTLAHTPGLTSPTAYQPESIAVTRAIITVPDDQVWESEFRQPSQSRAPPQG